MSATHGDRNIQRGLARTSAFTLFTILFMILLFPSKKFIFIYYFSPFLFFLLLPKVIIPIVSTSSNHPLTPPSLFSLLPSTCVAEGSLKFPVRFPSVYSVPFMNVSTMYTGWLVLSNSSSFLSILPFFLFPFPFDHHVAPKSCRE
ncbi:hypothetical protein BO83DRAFT_163869 [Aspergillus eucalypticola CBS 122712]|uniref:Uncharacterized protein n=1 Tax=Aspergillus eucalypticola (strain CBS 122712 / IBT 29274) TaxID=1448314 RepID=A0A317UNG9_ASPEC|nr:uncharacterized protein BO83DRAFT_163869 [Aspergillus eucalypticola CBS 122712]PWY63251.1 hypothetical protein BO83DRAFT_163869 [Aspergillus eucalypticola CBS 122712]